MKVSKNRKLTSILMMSLLWVSTTATHADVTPYSKNMNDNTTTSATFPEKLNKLINLPGKKDSIEIPIPKKIYKDLTYSLDYSTNLSKISNDLISFKDTNKNTVIATVKTTGTSNTIYIKDEDSNYTYSYKIGNGYLLDTGVEIYLKEDRYIEPYSVRLDYLVDKMDKYFIANGFKDKTPLFTFKDKKYEKDDVIVFLARHDLFRGASLSITATKKEIEDNRDSILESIKQHDRDLEFAPLDHLLQK